MAAVVLAGVRVRVRIRNTVRVRIRGKVRFRIRGNARVRIRVGLMLRVLLKVTVLRLGLRAWCGLRLGLGC